MVEFWGTRNVKCRTPLNPLEASIQSIVSQIKIELAHTDDESQIINCSKADVDQPPAKKQKYICKQFKDIIMGVELSDLQINMAQNFINLLKA